MSWLVRSLLCIVLVQCLLYRTIYCTLTCPKKSGADPSDVNGRLKALVKARNEFKYDDAATKYLYDWHVCKDTPDEVAAILQTGNKLKDPMELGRFTNAVVIGGTDWFMITYPDGTAYNSHCNKKKRKSSVMVTCDPDATIGTFKIIEEYRHSGNVTDECYYLFELNNKAACTVHQPTPTSLSPGSILLIVFLIVAGVYLVLGFLYQRYVAGAKGLEQIPHFNLWTAFGSLQADGCNFICRCREAQPKPRYKPVEDALSDDRNEETDDDDNLLPAV